MLISHHHLPSIGKAVEDVQMPSHSRLWQLPDPQKFAYSVSKATLLASIDVHRLDALLIRSEDVYYPEGLLRDFSSEVVIETLDESLPLHFDSADSLETAQEPSVQVEAATNNEIRLTVESDVPQESESLEIPIHRANRIVQAMHIPAGNWEITMRYIPHSFELGRWISLCSMVLLFFVLTVRKERKRSS